jgi:hypothetical protein
MLLGRNRFHVTEKTSATSSCTSVSWVDHSSMLLFRGGWAARVARSIMFAAGLPDGGQRVVGRCSGRSPLMPLHCVPFSAHALCRGCSGRERGLRWACSRATEVARVVFPLSAGLIVDDSERTVHAGGLLFWQPSVCRARWWHPRC